MKPFTLIPLISLVLAPLIGVRAERTALYNSFDMRLGSTPTPAHFNGAPALVYELHLTNFSAGVLSLRRLQVVEAKSRKIWADLSGPALASAIGRSDRPKEPAQMVAIPPGLHVTVYLTIPLDPVPSDDSTLVHRLEYSTETGRHQQGSVEGAPLRLVPTQLPISIGPPLRGSGWTAVYSDAWERGHRRTIYTTTGTLRIPGRFAIDWIRVAPNGAHTSGDENQIANWYGYGSDVLAVADAVVAAAHDDSPEPSTVDPKRVVEIEEASGSYVVLVLRDHKYAFYEHLKPGSISVRAGDRVRQGQVIARVGYTGQSTGPHLHFHVADSMSPLDSDGVPYVFKEFQILGRFTSADAVNRGEPWEPLSPNSRHRELPAPFDVVSFR